MASPYHAHFELRRETLGMACLMVFSALTVGAWAIVGQGPMGLRILAGVLALCLVALAVGIHRAREWARIGGMVPGVAYIALTCFQPKYFAIEPLCLLVGASTWLGLPATKLMFAKAREMIRRTEEIKREAAAKRAQYKRRIAGRAGSPRP